jgi:Pentapeptide repeats (8 copies)
MSILFSEVFRHCIMEALFMRWLKRDIWREGTVVAGMLLLLILIAWVPASAAGGQEGASGLAGPGAVTVQVTPTEDATATGLNKEKLAQEVKQLQQANDRSFSQWLWVYGSTLFSTLAIVGAGLFTLIRWLDDRQKERKKHDEERQADLQKQEKERFEALSSVVAGLGDEKEGTRVGAAIMLRTFFLRPGYEQFYSQTFDLVVAHLRLRGRHSASTEHLSSPSSSPPIVPHKPLTQGRQSELNTPLSLDPLSQTLIAVFKESFPLARSWMTKQSPQESPFDPLMLDAADIQLDKAYLPGTDLAHCRLPRAYLRQANLWGAHLQGANLGGAHLEGTLLQGALLQGTLLRGTLLQGALLRDANLQGALLRDANLQGANLSEAVLDGVHELEEVLSLKDTDLRGVKGLTKEQLEACKAKGAIIDEAPTISSPGSTVSPLPPSESSDTQAPSATRAQGSTPPPDTSGSSAAFSEPGSQS